MWKDDSKEKPGLQVWGNEIALSLGSFLGSVHKGF